MGCLQEASCLELKRGVKIGTRSGAGSCRAHMVWVNLGCPAVCQRPVNKMGMEFVDSWWLLEPLLHPVLWCSRPGAASAVVSWNWGPSFKNLPTTLKSQSFSVRKLQPHWKAERRNDVWKVKNLPKGNGMCRVRVTDQTYLFRVRGTHSAWKC